MNPNKIPSLQKSLSGITDPRQAEGRRYELVPVLLLCCVGLMTGYKSVKAIAEWGKNYGNKWLRRLGIKGTRSPSQPTLHRILRQVSIEELEVCLGNWASAVLADAENIAEELEAVAMDGKKLRGSHRHAAEGSYLLSVMSQRLGVVLAEVAIGAGENEITQAEQVIEKRCFERLVLTAEALPRQTDLVKRIIEKNADYLLVVKGNQPKLFEDIKYCFEQDRLVFDTIKEAVEIDQHGNRIEERRLRSTSILKDYVEFPFVEQVLEIRRIVRDNKSGLERIEVGYAITSLAEEKAAPKQLLKIWREHWHIENKLHYVRDVTFGEDLSQVRSGNVPQAMASLRNTAIGVLRASGFENIASALRKCSAKPKIAFQAIGLI